MAHWIDESIVIDFPLTSQMRELIDDCERLNKEDNYAFFGYADTLSNVCKWAVSQGDMTKEQWRLIELKYVYGDLEND